MKDQIERILRRVKGGATLLKKYPELKDTSPKVHVLFLNCILNSSGVYRMVLPYLSLNKTTTHKAIIGSMHKWDFNKSFEDYDNTIHRELIEWADYIVMPAMTSRIKPVYNVLKAIKPSVKIVLDFDRLTFVAPTVKSNAKLKEKLASHNGFANLEYADLISCSTAALADYYEKLTKELYPKKKLNFAIIPDQISEDVFIRLPNRDLNETKLRMGIVGTPAIAADFESASEQIKSFVKENSDKVKLILMGWNGRFQGKNLFEGIEVEHHKAVQFQKYFDKVHSLNLDVVLLPQSLSKRYSFGKSSIKLIELSALGVPAITDSNSKASKLISHGETGFVIAGESNWKTALEEALNGKTKLTEVGLVAQKFIWKHFSWNRFKTKLLANTYI